MKSRVARLAGGVALVLSMTRGPSAQAAHGPPRADQRSVDRATEHALKGETAFREGRYDDAMTEFGAGYAVLPRPGFLLNMGHVQKQVGNLKKARAYYSDYLEKDPKSKRRAEVKKLIAEIDAALNAGTGVASVAGGGTAPPPVAAPPLPTDVQLANVAGDEEVPDALKLSHRDYEAEQEGTSSPIYKRGWFWGTVGGVVVIGALAAFLVVRSGPGYTQSGTWGDLGR